MQIGIYRAASGAAALGPLTEGAKASIQLLNNLKFIRQFGIERVAERSESK